MRHALHTRPLSMADADAALLLYNQLTAGPKAPSSAPFRAVLEHPGTTVCGAFDGADLCAMVTLHLMPNVLWEARPFGLIENVITHEARRKAGHGARALQAAIDTARAAGCYKIMLMTGQARGALGFYEKLGFSSKDKHAMVLRLP